MFTSPELKLLHVLIAFYLELVVDYGETYWEDRSEHSE